MRPLPINRTARTKNGLRRRNAALYWGPFFAGLVVFNILPFFVMTVTSLTAGGGFGLGNYVSLLQSEAFLLAVKNSFRFIAVSVPLLMGLAFVTALGIFWWGKNSSVFITIFLFPLVIPIASTTMTLHIFFEQGGIVNYLLGAVGAMPQDWLQTDKVFYLLVGLYLWKNLGFVIILYLASLSSIPYEGVEVAKVEGANPLQIVSRVILPQMKPMFVFVFVLSVINSLNSFKEAYLIGGDSPQDSIYTLQHFFNANFANINYPRLASASQLVFFLFLVLILLLAPVIKKGSIDEVDQ